MLRSPEQPLVSTRAVIVRLGPIIVQRSPEQPLVSTRAVIVRLGPIKSKIVNQPTSELTYCYRYYCALCIVYCVLCIVYYCYYNILINIQYD